MPSNHYSPRPCSVDACRNHTVTGAETCWEHIENKAAFLSGLDPAVLAGAWLAELDWSVLSQPRSLRGVDISGARLSRAKLIGADLRGANLHRAFLDGTDLRGADLSGANLEMAVLGGADVSGAHFRGANLRRANLVGTRGHAADFTDADLYYARPGNADLQHADFTGARIERTIFRRANLTGAILVNAAGTANFEHARLEGIRR